MLKIVVPAFELFDDETSTFIPVSEQTLQLEYSLVSLSKWESKWKKPYLTNAQKTKAEFCDYIRCMTITQNVDPKVYLGIPDNVLLKVHEYTNDSMTATTFGNTGPKERMNGFITSELIYYWMIIRGIPFECQKWHLNRLFALIRVYDSKESPQKKMSRKDILQQNAALNAARRKRYNTRG